MTSLIVPRLTRLPMPLRWPRLGYAAAWLCLAILLVMAGLFTNIDHDEGQYVAAVALMRDGLPYRDFAFLQTPLQPLLFAPLASICEGWLFPALRALNALLSAGAVGILWLAASQMHASRRSATFAAFCLASSHMLLFAATAARNDALPLFLHVTGLWLFLASLHGKAGEQGMKLMAAGLALGSAASAKISYGLPAAAIGLFALIHWRTLRAPQVVALAIGGLIGGLPTFWLWMLAPEAARFGIIDYSLTAPFEWRMLNGQSFIFGTQLSILRLLRFLAQGCGLVALLTVALSWVTRRPVLSVEPLRMQVRLLDMVIAAGLLAAWLPRPIYVQYLGPILPALFLRFALLVDRPNWKRMPFAGLLLIFMVAGLSQTALEIVRNLATGRSPVLAAKDDAHRIGELVRESGAPGAIATLSPEYVVDSGIPLDPRFATGVFLFRTRSVMTQDEARRFHALTTKSATAGLNAMPPSAIFVGREMDSSPAAPQGLDSSLILWAKRHGYRAVSLPATRAQLYLRPSEGRTAHETEL